MRRYPYRVNLRVPAEHGLMVHFKYKDICEVVRRIYSSDYMANYSFEIRPSFYAKGESNDKIREHSVCATLDNRDFTRNSDVLGKNFEGICNELCYWDLVVKFGGRGYQISKDCRVIKSWETDDGMS